jgi:hypothetical protein
MMMIKIFALLIMQNFMVGNFCINFQKRICFYLEKRRRNFKDIYFWAHLCGNNIEFPLCNLYLFEYFLERVFTILHQLMWIFLRNLKNFRYTSSDRVRTIDVSRLIMKTPFWKCPGIRSSWKKFWFHLQMIYFAIYFLYFEY